jgi:hypothetical protein
MTNTNVREGVSPNISASIGRGAIYLADFWEDHIRPEIEAPSIEDHIRPEIEAPSIEDTPVHWQETQVHWQGTRLVLGPSGYYVPDGSRAQRYMGGKYKEGKEGVESAYEGFLELPPAVVLLVLWVAGAVLLGSCALVLYMAGSVVVRSLAGSL